MPFRPPAPGRLGLASRTIIPFDPSAFLMMTPSRSWFRPCLPAELPISLNIALLIAALLLSVSARAESNAPPPGNFAEARSGVPEGGGGMAGHEAWLGYAPVPHASSLQSYGRVVRFGNSE